MKLGVLTVLKSNQPLEEVLAFLKDKGVTAVEIGTGGYPGNAHLNPDEILNDKAGIKNFKELIKKYDMEISALSCHGNPVHPNKETAAKYHDDFVKTLKLAKELGINRIITFSGCPGGSPADKYPNWVTCPWPEDFMEVLKYQWDEVLVPYWKEAVKLAAGYGVDKICLEMHPGFCVYNPETLLKLRAQAGDAIGANFDPSHLFWQGIDPVYAIRELEGAIYHFHAKDTRIDKYNTAKNGVLDTKHYSDEKNRSWVFRTVGYGNDHDVWKDMMSTLRKTGYDDVVSIEHEDSLMSVDEGLTKAIEFLKEVMMFETTSGMWWA